MVGRRAPVVTVVATGGDFTLDPGASRGTRARTPRSPSSGCSTLCAERARGSRGRSTSASSRPSRATTPCFVGSASTPTAEVTVASAPSSSRMGASTYGAARRSTSPTLSPASTGTTWSRSSGRPAGASTKPAAMSSRGGWTSRRRDCAAARWLRSWPTCAASASRSPRQGRRERLAKVTKYLTDHVHRMPYAELRRDDLDIGTGAVEGAVRNLVGLRLDGPGMRWGRERSELVLHLRCVLLNGQWDDFRRFLEHSRLKLAPQPAPARPHDAVRQEAA